MSKSIFIIIYCACGNLLVVFLGAKKTVRHFSAVTDFLTYCDETIGSLQPEMQKIADQRNKRDELLSKIELLRKDINQRATARVERKKKIKEVYFKDQFRKKIFL